MYVAVKGGERAIENAHRWLDDERRGDRAIPDMDCLQIEEQYRDVRYLNNCKKDIKANGIKTDDPTAYCAGLVRQDPYLFTYNRGFVGKYLQQNTGNAPQQPAPQTEPKK
mgnify:CR=1 FL=1